MSTKRIIVTGSSGKAGHWIVKHLVEEGYEVTSIDTHPPAKPLGHTLTADLTDLGATIDAFGPHVTGNRAPYDGVIHMAAIPRPWMHANKEVFRVNTLSTYNVLEACGLLGIQKAVIASSESSYGFCFANEPFDPKYLPIDESHPQLPEDTYGLTKIINEQTAEMFHRRDGTQIISFRIANVIGPEDHEPIRARFDHPEGRARIFWSYIDARDLAAACQLAIEKNGLGCEPVLVSADDSSSNVPSEELVKRFYPNVREFKSPLTGYNSFVSNKRIKELLGWKQKHFLSKD